MRAESNIMPETVVLERKSEGMCDVVINVNIKSIDKSDINNENDLYYEYDSYRFEAIWRAGLVDIITNDLESWVKYAQSIENTPKELSDKEKILLLTQENDKLKKDNLALKSDNELFKECIMELANEVFA